MRAHWKATFSGATLLAASLATVPSDAAIPEAEARFVSARYELGLGSSAAGWVQSVEGGHATSDVVAEAMGSDHIVHKHIGGVRYEDITLHFGTGMSSALYQWIKDSLTSPNPQPKSGWVDAVDFNDKQTSRLTFVNGIINEIGFPALDAASKDAGYLSIKIAPETTRFSMGNGAAVATHQAVATQKKWLPSNFRLKIDGLEAATARVSKIDALTIKQKVVEHPVGERRDYAKEPNTFEMPNLVITLPEAYAQDWYKWHEDFVIKGHNGQANEKAGTLTFLAPDMNTVYFTVTFQNLGIFKLMPEKVEAGSENIRRVKAEMYAEKVSFEFNPAAAF